MNDVFGPRLNVWTSIVMFVAAAAYFVWAARRHPGRETVVFTNRRAGFHPGRTTPGTTLPTMLSTRPRTPRRTSPTSRRSRGRPDDQRAE